MSKNSKLINRVLSNPKDLKWDEMVTFLSHYGYREIKTGKTGGSRRKFVDDKKNIISFLHEPHPQKIMKHYAIKEVITHLKEKGRIKDE